MKKKIRKKLKIYIAGLLFLLNSLHIVAQPVIIEPGDKAINPAILNTGSFIWAINMEEDLYVKVERNNQQIKMVRRRITKGLEDADTMILNAKTLEPISNGYKGEEVLYNLQFGASVKGTRTIFETNEKQKLNEVIPRRYFHKQSIPLIISTLPLNIGYRAVIPVININSNFKPEYLRFKITNVSEIKSFSCFTGVHNVWKVEVTEASKNFELYLYIDQVTRRILRENYGGESITSKIIAYTDTEADFNPVKAEFNADETKAMLSGGTAIIKGQAFTTDGAPKSILQRKKKVYAPMGSLVVLLPNTLYLKEWMNFNLKNDALAKYTGKEINLAIERGQTCIYPLPAEIKKHHIVTEVVDDKGNFAFQNLKSGEYLVFVTFVATKYSHTTRTPNGTYNITINSDGSGSATQNVDVNHWGKTQSIINYEFVKISKEGETMSVKLK